MDAPASSRRRANPSKGNEGRVNKRHRPSAKSRQNQEPLPDSPAPPSQPATQVQPSIPVPSDSMRFAELEGLLDPLLLKTITDDMKFNHMLPVQEATIHDLLQKRIDCLAQAKTGTGKTIAFLLPAIQKLINKKRSAGSGISLLVISPTRELAMQIAKEASMLLQRLPAFKVCVAIGGTKKDKEERDILSKNGCDILIATPGRLNDHFGNQRILDLVQQLDTLVLDEADRLLDMGFLNELKAIIKCLPDKKQTGRQGMLFSATISNHVQQFAHLVLSDGYKFITTIPAGEAQVHEHVPQVLVKVATWSAVVPAMVWSIKHECGLMGAATFKAIVFAPTAALADFYHYVLSTISGLPPVSVLHARISQSKRTKVTNDYRNASSAVLVATDVVARGLDFPDVSNVFQVGLPADRESYIHRLGRTARAGKKGRSVFIITEAESFFPQFVLKAITFESATPDLSSSPEVTAIVDGYDAKTKTYQAWLGFYKAHAKSLKWSDNQLVAEANKFAIEAMGCDEIPPLERKTVGKMGLKGAKGLNIVANRPSEGRAHGNGGGRARGPKPQN